MSKQRTQERLTFWLVLGLFAALLVNLNLFYFRLDLSSAGAFTVAPASKGIVAQAKENIYITYYLTAKLKDKYPFAQAIEDFLVEYANASAGKVKVKIVDPVEAKLTDKAERLGIQPNRMNKTDKYEASQSTVYTGIHLQYLDREEVLPVVTQAETIEYEVSSRVNKLITNKSKSIGLLLGDSRKTLENSFRLLNKSMTGAGSFRIINPGETIDPALTVLIVSGGPNLTETDAFNVDQYIMAGGKVLFAVDGINIDVQSQQPAPAAGEPLLKLLGEYGINIGSQFINDPVSKVVPFNSQYGAVMTQYTLWPQIVAQDTSSTHPVTSRFPGLDLMWTTEVKVNPKDGVKAEPIAWTSPKSWLMMQPTIDPQQAAASQAMNTEPTQSRNVVWSLTGTFTSPYNSGNAPKKPGQTTVPTIQPKSPETRMLVVGDSDFLSDLVQYSQSQYNLLFTENAVEWLGQDDALLSIKTRPMRDTSLNKIQNKADRDGAAFWLLLINLGLVPAGLITVWAVRTINRRQRELKG